MELNRRCVTEPLLIILCQTLYVFHLYHHGSLSAGRYDKYASIVVFAWGSTSVGSANSLTMMLVIESLILYLLCLLSVRIGVCLAKGSFCDFRFLNSSITATDVEYVGAYMITLQVDMVWMQSMESNT